VIDVKQGRVVKQMHTPSYRYKMEKGTNTESITSFGCGQCARVAEEALAMEIRRSNLEGLGSGDLSVRKFVNVSTRAR